MRHRLCLGCLARWTGSEAPLCPACQMEHELRSEITDDGRRNDSEVDWWGATGDSISPEDIEDGFYIASNS